MEKQNKLFVSLFFGFLVAINLIVTFYPVKLQIFLTKLLVQDKFLYLDIKTADPDYEAIKNLKDKQIFNDDDLYFHPEQAVKREDFVKIILTAYGYKPDEQIDLSCFNDLTDIKTAEYICLAKKLGFISGDMDNSYFPEKEINRAEALTILGKVSNWPVSTKDDGERIIFFLDLKQTDWFYPYVDYAVKNGIFIEQNKYFRPEEILIKKEMVEILDKSLLNKDQTR